MGYGNDLPEIGPSQLSGSEGVMKCHLASGVTATLSPNRTKKALSDVGVPGRVLGFACTSCLTFCDFKCPGQRTAPQLAPGDSFVRLGPI